MYELSGILPIWSKRDIDMSSILDFATPDHLAFEGRAHSRLFVRGVARGCHRDLLEPLKETFYLSDSTLSYVPFFLAIIISIIGSCGTYSDSPSLLIQGLLTTIPASTLTPTVLPSQSFTTERTPRADHERPNCDASLTNELARLALGQICSGLSGGGETRPRFCGWAVRSRQGRVGPGCGRPVQCTGTLTTTKQRNTSWTFDLPFFYMGHGNFSSSLLCNLTTERPLVSVCLTTSPPRSGRSGRCTNYPLTLSWKVLDRLVP